MKWGITTESMCLDTGSSVTLIDRGFLLAQFPDAKILKMASPLSVRGIESNKHQTSEYVVVPIYIESIRHGMSAVAKITGEAHVVDGL